MGFLSKVFYNIGKGVTHHPFIVFVSAFLVTMTCGFGFINFRATADPQELWVPKTSRANIEQEYFKNHFGSFFRINEMMIVPAGEGKDTQDIFRPGYLHLLYYLQTAIEQGTIERDGKIYRHDDFCYKPITGQGCLVTSPMGFWKMNQTAIPKTADAVKLDAQCIPRADQSGRVCFDRIGVPVQVSAIFGGTTCIKDDSQPCAPCITDASAYMVTFLLNNNDYSNPIAEQWEKEVFIKNVKTFNQFADYQTELPKGLDDYNTTLYKQLESVYNQTDNSEMLKLKIDYLAERSIPDQLGEIGDQNKNVIFLSYILMFVYVGLALGYFPSFVHNRFILGFGGIMVVLMSIVIAIGITLFMNIPLSLISSEVVPFLILAIGVDNMFIIVRAEQEVSKDVTVVEERVALALKEVGPSIFTAAFCESLAFFVGMLTRVPALESFCLVAALGVLADFLLQITFFTAALTLDAKRIRDNRCDILPCIKRKKKTEPRKAIVRSLFQKYFVPFLFNKKTEIMVYFLSTVFVSLGIVA
jgi:Niemann-Pick C1 protein